MKIGSSTVDISPNKSKESRETELFHDGAKKPEHTSEEITGVFTMVNKNVRETCDKFEDV